MVPRLHLITDDRVLDEPDFVGVAGRILAAHGAALALHLRGHRQSGARLWELARELVRLAEASSALLLVNDRVDVALAAGAGGVQLGVRGLPVAACRGLLGSGRTIGYSAHDAAEARAAADDGADFVIVGTIYESASHPGRAAAGPELLRVTARDVTVPVIAIGGVTPDRGPEVRHAGAHGAAVLSGVWHAADPVAAAATYLAALG